MASRIIKTTILDVRQKLNWLKTETMTRKIIFSPADTKLLLFVINFVSFFLSSVWNFYHSRQIFEAIPLIFLSYVLYFIFGVFFFRYWIERAWDSIQWQKTKTKNLSLVHQNGGMRKWNYRSSDVNFMISLFQRNSCLKIGPHQTFENHCTEKTNWFRTYFRPIWLPCRRLMLIFVNKHKRYTTFV